MAVHLIGWTPMNIVVSHLSTTKAAVRREARLIEGKARANLAAANETSRITPKDYFPAYIDADEGDVDCYVNLHAPNAMALEFGHAPSGVFGPDGRYGHIKTKPPEGRYIVSRAAGLAG